ncbi:MULTISPECIES: nuclear transport factor 2 family protein [unclassified Rhizobium]|uniref:nuclear transport factor 2 family protein n=1 Tax=unclassified Rhizobium TaxID=2613769 RepID=UPI001620642C|nr:MULTISPECIES: nuclear transport factor 2 family protein [unclassified Rhizobium]MBB3386211.1 ketosteroid isomerase-like protein [Rhizobium sp. BK098]MBB3571187.1 ketosteroid isomerase-like protein [Rhizobium sp. BK491]MBB3617915.1 ketosteroid isomerase-like protein [Rhizobium sp. BK609]MBB3683632.1 ketosteroid isomerase-like protein [Rhizobium sp. BK612]
MNTNPAPRTSVGVDALARLVASEDIRQLKSRYFSAVDTKDWQAISSMFTDDARVDFSGECQHHVGHHGVTEDSINPADWVVIGGDATAKVIEGAVGGIVAVHQGHDPQIEIHTPETASGRWTLYDRLEYGGEIMHGYGHYDEQYRLVGGQWRIASLTLTRIRVVWETK